MTFIPRPESLHSPEYEVFLRLLVEARRNAGLSQRDLAKRLGKPQSYVCKCELGERRVDVVELVALYGAIGVSCPEFITQLMGAYF